MIGVCDNNSSLKFQPGNESDAVGFFANKESKDGGLLIFDKSIILSFKISLLIGDWTSPCRTKPKLLFVSQSARISKSSIE